jgi:hypothetical protein
MGMTPLSLLLYAASDLRLIKAEIRLDDELLRFLIDRGIPRVDTALPVHLAALSVHCS